jgi:hypothetical protein
MIRVRAANRQEVTGLIFCPFSTTFNQGRCVASLQPQLPHWVKPGSIHPHAQVVRFPHDSRRGL